MSTLCNFINDFLDLCIQYFQWKCALVILADPIDWYQVNIGSGHGMVTSVATFTNIV